MITTTIKIDIKESYKDAPNYPATTKPLTLKSAIVVKKGMESGMPSVDIQLTDESGNHYIAMVSGMVLEGIAAAVQGAR